MKLVSIDRATSVIKQRKKIKKLTTEMFYNDLSPAQLSLGHGCNSIYFFVKKICKQFI